MQDLSIPVEDPSRPPRTLNELIARLEDDASSPIVLINDQGTVLFVSTTYVRVTGYHRHESVGRWLIERVHPDDRAEIRDYVSSPVAAQPDGIEGRYRLRAGAWRRFVFSVSWCTTTDERIAIVRMRAAAKAAGPGDRATDAPIQRCNAHQTILSLEPIVRRIAGISVEVVYRLEATALHIGLNPFQL